jgi:TldD protein
MDRLFDIGDSFAIPGISFGEAFIQRGFSRHCLFDDGKFEEISSSTTEGVGARIVVGDRTYFTHSTGATPFAASFSLQEGLGRAGINNGPKLLTETRPLLPVPTLPDETPFERIRHLDRQTRMLSSMVRQVTFGWSSGAGEIAIAGSVNPVCRMSTASTRFSATVVVEKGGALFSGREVRASRLSQKEFLDSTDLENVAQEAFRRSMLLADAIPCPAGIMPVVLAGSAGGTMIHEACGHSLEADIVLKDFSSFRSSMGKKVASSLVTLADDPRIPGLFGSYAFDSEGTVSRRTILIREGILGSFLTDIHSARQGGFPLTGNGRRSSYRFPPVPRMSNTFIMKGNEDPETIISQVEEGLLVIKMGGGEVNPTSGDFVFHVTEGYLIKGGSKTVPVKNAILTGNGPDVLMDIDAVGTDLHFEPGICGKSGQEVPVTDGQPTIRIRHLVVGGSDTRDEGHP